MGLPKQPMVMSLSGEEVEAPAGAPDPLPPAPGSRVLIVEDQADYRRVLCCLLRDQGLEVREAEDGGQGLKLAVEETPDLVLLDFDLPVMNGYELFVALRSREETRKVPVILLTGFVNRRHLRTLGLDLSDFLDKPVSNRLLVENVLRVLGRSHGGLPSSAAAPVEAPSSEPLRASEAIAPADALKAPPSLPAPEPAARAPEPPTLPPAAPQPARAPGPAPAPSIEAALAQRSSPKPRKEPGRPSRPQWPEPPSEAVKIRLGRTTDAPPAPSGRPAAELDVDAGYDSEDPPLLTRVQQMLEQAVAEGASDIHIEPHETRVVVRLRVDGSLVELCTFPPGALPRLVSRLKIMSNLVITEHRLPQDGQFRMEIGGQPIEFRVSTVPAAYGEKIVLRILSGRGLTARLDGLGLSVRDRDAMVRALRGSHGLILVTGPTGSGKTSTLYCMLSSLNTPDVNIMTAEDPIEYRLEGVNHVQVRPQLGFTFESALRAFLRQDPDVMLVGEIRDRETAEIAAKAAVTGHLVLSTIHTNSAPATVARLVQIGVPPYLIAASVKLLVAQRLVRRLCPSCAVPAPLTDEDRRALTESEAAAAAGARRGAGCERCRRTGYGGRMPLFEVMEVRSPEMRDAILTAPQPDRLAEIARREGMTTLRSAALHAVASGSTTLDEAYKVIFGE